jgi:hypothetical protein
MIPFSQQQKIYIDDGIEVDLLKTNNVWETEDRVITGSIGDFKWSELLQYFNITRMTGSGSSRHTQSRPQPLLQPLLQPQSKGDTIQISGYMRTYLEENQMTVMSAKQKKDNSIIVVVKCFCPFARRHHTSNNCYVIFKDSTATLRCYSETKTDCRKGRKSLDDWQPEDVNGHVDDVNGHVDDVNGHVDDGTKTLDSTVSALVNRWLLSKLDDTSDEMQSKVSAMEHTVTKGRSEGKDNITITNASGVRVRVRIKRHSGLGAKWV